MTGASLVLAVIALVLLAFILIILAVATGIILAVATIVKVVRVKPETPLNAYET